MEKPNCSKNSSDSQYKTPLMRNKTVLNEPRFFFRSAPNYTLVETHGLHVREFSAIRILDLPFNLDLLHTLMGSSLCFLQFVIEICEVFFV